MFSQINDSNVAKTLLCAQCVAYVLSAFYAHDVLFVLYALYGAYVLQWPLKFWGQAYFQLVKKWLLYSLCFQVFL